MLDSLRLARARQRLLVQLKTLKSTYTGETN